MSKTILYKKIKLNRKFHSNEKVSQRSLSHKHKERIKCDMFTSHHFVIIAIRRALIIIKVESFYGPRKIDLVFDSINSNQFKNLIIRFTRNSTLKNNSQSIGIPNFETLRLFFTYLPITENVFKFIPKSFTCSSEVLLFLFWDSVIFCLMKIFSIST